MRHIDINKLRVGMRICVKKEQKTWNSTFTGEYYMPDYDDGNPKNLSYPVIGKVLRTSYFPEDDGVCVEVYGKPYGFSGQYNDFYLLVSEMPKNVETL